MCTVDGLQVRASALSGECNLMDEVLRGKVSNFGAHHQVKEGFMSVMAASPRLLEMRSEEGRSVRHGEPQLSQ